MKKPGKAKTQTVSARVESDLITEIAKDGVPMSKVLEVLLKDWISYDEEKKKELLISHLTSDDWTAVSAVTQKEVDRRLLKGLSLVSIGLLLTPGIGSLLGAMGGALLADKADLFEEKITEALSGIRDLMSRGKNGDAKS